MLRRTWLTVSITLVSILLQSVPTAAFEVDQFRAGMSRALVKELLADWGFDQTEDIGGDLLLAYDLPQKQTNRLFKFTFCSDKLVAFEQALKPSTKNFVTVTQNYVRQYGQPIKVDATTNVVSNGEKGTMTLYWRIRNYYVGLRYITLPTGEDLAVIYEINNNCWQAPRGN